MPAIQELPTPLGAFLQIIREWVDAIEAGGLPNANAKSDTMKRTGLLLAYDPEFRRIFLENRDGCEEDDPEYVLNCIYGFFKALNDAALSGRYRATR